MRPPSISTERALRAFWESPSGPIGGEESESMRILIVGAGVAGITAGHLLAEHGVEFEIFEASATYGGRVRKVDDFVDFPIDLGSCGAWRG